MIKSEIYFGLGKADGTTVSEKDAGEFIFVDVVSRFPEGLTVLRGGGIWMYGPKFPERYGETVQEQTIIVIIVHKGSDINWENLDLIQQIYKTRFSQEATMAVHTEVQACFSANYMAERARD